MASAIIHLCVAKKVGQIIGRNDYQLMLGSIAPDIAKIIGQHKNVMHFITAKDDIPDIKYFLSKYQKSLNNSFELGYFIHLYTDKLWFKYFINQLVASDAIKLKDGTVLSTTYDFLCELIYNDYTNINIDLIDRYQLNLSLFYNDLKMFTTSIEEYPVKETPKLIDKMGIIIANSKSDNTYVLDLKQIENFIEFATKKIIDKLNKIL